LVPTGSTTILLAAGSDIQAGVYETEVVYSYSSAFRKFSHVRFCAACSEAIATVDFVITWKNEEGDDR
jgi:hypothetical protein